MSHRKTPTQLLKEESISLLKKKSSRSLIPSKSKISRNKLKKLELKIQGRLIYPWSPDYNQYKNDFSNTYPTDPKIIALVENYNDIRELLSFANSIDLWTVIRSGGHSLADYSVCDGLVIDLRNLNSIYVDYNNKTVTVDSAVLFGKLNGHLESYGLHLPGGGCPTVAVAGYMMGGGYGLTSRTFGMNCDNVLAVTVMLANGGIVVANESQNEDMYWAIRGGTGGNFGVLLNITYRVYELGNIFGVKIDWDINDNLPDAARALYTMQNELLTQDKYPNFGMQIPITMDTDRHRKVMFRGTWVGDQASLEEAIQPLTSLNGASDIQIKNGKYSTINGWLLEGVPNIPHTVQTNAFTRSMYIDHQLGTSDWEAILSYFMKTAPNDYTMIDLEFYGGRINEFPIENSAFIHRNVQMDFFCDALYNSITNDREANKIWLEGFFNFLAQYGNGHSYQNYPNRNQRDYRWAYWGNYYTQLVTIKNKYDPDNFFRYQQSIGPDAEMKEMKDQKILFKETKIVYEPY